MPRTKLGHGGTDAGREQVFAMLEKTMNKTEKGMDLASVLVQF